MCVVGVLQCVAMCTYIWVSRHGSVRVLLFDGNFGIYVLYVCCSRVAMCCDVYIHLGVMALCACRSLVAILVLTCCMCVVGVLHYVAMCKYLCIFPPCACTTLWSLLWYICVAFTCCLYGLIYEARGDRLNGGGMTVIFLRESAQTKRDGLCCIKQARSMVILFL